jgi:chromosome segregation ATPase
MADETLTTQADPQASASDSQGGLSDGQESTQSQGNSTTPADGGVEKRFKDTQAAFTRSQQELQATRKALEEFKARYENETVPMQSKMERLAAALRDGQEPSPEYTPEQIEAANRMIASTPAFKEIQQKAQAFEQQTAAQRAEAYKAAIAQGAEKITELRKLDAATQDKLRQHIEADPVLMFGIQQARTPQDALRAFDRAYRDMYFDTLERNSLQEGTKAVEQKLAQMERSTAVEQPSNASGVSDTTPYKGNFKDYFRQTALEEAGKLGL